MIHRGASASVNTRARSRLEHLQEVERGEPAVRVVRARVVDDVVLLVLGSEADEDREEREHHLAEHEDRAEQRTHVPFASSQ